MRNLMRWLLGSVCAAWFALAWAQAYPSRPIRLVVPSVPGGGLDFMARLLAPPLSASLGQSVAVENRGGSAGTVGTEVVARAAPDGYTVLISADSMVSAIPLMKLPYDPFKDFEPVALLSRNPYVIVVNASGPRDLNEFIRMARVKPGALTYGSPGTGSSHHMISLMFGSAAGISMLHVPYKGSGQLVPALLSNEVQVVVQSLSGMLSSIKGGKLRALAVTAARRVDSLPEAPTVGEAGFPELEADIWFGAWAPAGTPREVLKRLQSEMMKVMQDPAIAKERLAPLGFNAPPGSGAELLDLMKRDLMRWSRIVRENNIKIDE